MVDGNCRDYTGIGHPVDYTWRTLLQAERPQPVFHNGAIAKPYFMEVMRMDCKQCRGHRTVGPLMDLMLRPPVEQARYEEQVRLKQEQCPRCRGTGIEPFSNLNNKGANMNATAFPDKNNAGDFRVEHFGDDGECYVTIFTASKAEKRAIDYREWLNAKAEPSK